MCVLSLRVSAPELGVSQSLNARIAQLCDAQAHTQASCVLGKLSVTESRPQPLGTSSMLLIMSSAENV